MGKGAVKVVLRTRPTEYFAANSLQFLEGSTVGFYYPRRKDKGPLNNTQEHYSFRLDDILHNASQERVFDATCRNIVDSVVQGFNGTIMAYGQTGAGKTYTMTGGTDFRSRGLIPRAVTDVFSSIAHLPEKAFDVEVSYVEIYNEKIIDLLDDADSAEPVGTAHLAIQEDSTGISVKGLTKRAAKSEAEALSHLFDGNNRRMVSNHATNNASSRSHCIFTLHVKSRSRVESDSHILASKLNLVDLAGSERVAKTGSEGSTLREATYINKSLSFLEQVVIALGSQGRSHVPYRQCKLTNVLKDSIGGNCKTVMIANAWGEEQHLDETLSTLKFATRMMKVQNEASVNVELDSASHIKALQRQIAELKAELQMQNQLHGKSHVKYDAFSDEERFELEKKVEQYLAGSTDDIEIRNLRDVKEYFKLFKACVARATAEAEERLRGKFELTERSNAVEAAAVQGGGAPGGLGGVGELDGAAGFGVGTGAAAKNIKQALAGSPKGGSASMIPRPPSDNIIPQDATCARTTTLPNRSDAYEDFKQNEGAELVKNMKNSLTRLKELKQEGSDLTSAAANLKAEIEILKKTLEKAEVEAGDDDNADEETFAGYEELKRKRLAFRDIHENVCRLRLERESAQKLLNQARQQLITNFENWYEKTYNASAGNGKSAAPDEEDEQLDEGETFEKMEMEKLTREDPDALEFYKAQKMTLVKTRTTKRGAGWAAARK